MKTYSKLLSRSTILCASAIMFWSTNVTASVNSAEIPNSSIGTVLSDLSTPPPTGLQIVSITPFTYNGDVHVRCWGQNSGRATVVATGGVAPYTYQWSGLPSQTGPTAVGMYAGTYSVIVTDALGISVTGSVTLIQNPPLTAIATAAPILCNGGVTTIYVSASGGTLPYSGLNWFDVIPGQYNFTVADANGCRNQVTKTIVEPPVFEATAIASPILCNGDLSNVLVEASGGTGPYNGVGLNQESAGMAYYTITDANGCYTYTSVSINQPVVLAADISHTSIDCRGGDSEVTVTGLGGIPPYIGTGSFTQSAGMYQYTITDGNGCQSTSSVVITQPSALVATISNTSIACNGDLSTVEVTASGGTTPIAGPGIFMEPAGLHSYNLTDANGCTVDISTMILEPRELDLDLSWALIENPGGTTVVEVIAAGGIAPHTGTGFFTVGAGVHSFTVIDANGCSITETITVDPYDPSALLLAGANESQNAWAKTNTIDDNHSFVRAAYNTQSEEMEIAYRLEYDSKVSIEIYDMTGALVEVVQEDMAIEGENYTISIEPGKLTTGVYIYQFVTDSERQIDKLQIIR